jgi:transcriptional regulator with XRE-family HTH domain
MNGDRAAIEYGKRLREARGRRTQSEVAEMLGVSRSSVANIELGRQRHNHHQVALAAAVLGVDPGWLLTGEGDPGGPINANELRAYIPDEPPPRSVVQAGPPQRGTVWQRGHLPLGADQWYPALDQREGALEPLPWRYLLAIYGSVTVLRWGTGETDP